MDPITLGIILALSGTALSASASRKAAKRGDAELAVQRKRQKETTDKSRQSVLDNLREYDPTKRAEAQEQLAATGEAGITSELVKAAAETAGATPGPTGVVSQDYLTSKANATRDRANNASAMAGLLARFRAPQELRTEEARKNAEYGSREDVLSSLLRSRKNTGDQLVALESRPNQGKMALGSLLNTVGMGVATGGIGSGASAAAPSAGSLGSSFWNTMGKGVRAFT